MIHRYSKKGINFLLDVNSGAVHVLDDLSYELAGLVDENMGETCPQEIVDRCPSFRRQMSLRLIMSCMN